ncbi:hypothetical protein Cgig2_024793 [Carnegiea gigantea]|uniref:Uncharacterized protein n=1 Tax=Carnegiea gigantea TaxID=171969 RepID=A0A9Q1QCI1_9CARY|nr:hypothetical protein Cgig2_024793 [Carnegiea gigantea]
MDGDGVAIGGSGSGREVVVLKYDRGMVMKLEGDGDVRMFLKGNDEHGYLYVGDNDGPKRRAQKAMRSYDHGVTCRRNGRDRDDMVQESRKEAGDRQSCAPSPFSPPAHPTHPFTLGLPDSTEHAKLYFIINTQTGVKVGSQLTTQELWMATSCASTTWNIRTIQQIFNLHSITFVVGIKVGTGITISAPRVSNFAAFRAPPRLNPLLRISKSVSVSTTSSSSQKNNTPSHPPASPQAPMQLGSRNCIDDSMSSTNVKRPNLSPSDFTTDLGCQNKSVEKERKQTMKAAWRSHGLIGDWRNHGLEKSPAKLQGIHQIKARGRLEKSRLDSSTAWRNHGLEKSPNHRRRSFRGTKSWLDSSISSQACELRVVGYWAWVADRGRLEKEKKTGLELWKREGQTLR